jgi:hypothetical protein
LAFIPWPPRRPRRASARSRRSSARSSRRRTTPRPHGRVPSTCAHVCAGRRSSTTTRACSGWRTCGRRSSAPSTSSTRMRSSAFRTSRTRRPAARARRRRPRRRVSPSLLSACPVPRRLTRARPRRESACEPQTVDGLLHHCALCYHTLITTRPNTRLCQLDTMRARPAVGPPRARPGSALVPSLPPPPPRSVGAPPRLLGVRTPCASRRACRPPRPRRPS